MMGSLVDTSGPIPVESTSSLIPPPTSDNHLLLVDEQKMFDIVKPHHQDVLCGRGVTTNRHPGNESFRSLVGLNKELYVSSTKREKMGISRSIVQAVRSLDPPGRFLDKDPLSGLWHDIGHKKAVEKTSQALRDGAAMLRKQLSDDLGDPYFLDGVFSEDGTDNFKEDGDNDKKKKKGGKEKGTIRINGKENNKGTKGQSPEKVKAIKPALVKKGHRRIKSNPSELAKLTSKARRIKTQNEPRTPGGTSYPPPWNYSMYPPSPRSPGPPPPPPHGRSLPNSPMTWGGGPPPYPERHRSYPLPHHSPYHQAPHPPYSKPPSYSRSHSFDYHNGPSDPGLPPRHHSWSPHGSSRHHDTRYHHQHSHDDHYYHHQHRSPPTAGMYAPTSPAPTRSLSPPSPTSSSGPMPLGQDKYSPGDYYSDQPPAGEPWSPRRGYRHQYEAYDSPGQYPPSPYHHGECIPERSPSWTPRSASPQQHRHHDHYYDHPDYHDNNESSGDLSVPCLRGEGRPSSSKGGYSPQLHLSPRSTSRSFRPVIHRPSGAPPRSPSSYDRDRQQEFRPPSPRSPRYQRAKEDHPHYHCDRVEEEKKTSDMDEKINISHQRQSASKNDIISNSKVDVAEVPSRPEPVKSESRSSPDQEEVERESLQVGDNKDKDQGEHRVSPGKFIPVTGVETNEAMEEDDSSEEGQPVDDISMSPLPYDREDPVTLLDLPDDIMNLPISSCGPHDDCALDEISNDELI